MNDIHSIFINILSNIIWFLAGAFIVSILYFVRVRLPRRRLWRLTDPRSLVVCVSNVATMYTGVYYRPATGIGELRAFTLMEKSLTNAYRRELDIKNILLASDHLQERLENDLLLLGGPKYNKVTKKFLELVDGEQPVQLTEDAIIWKSNKNAKKWTDNGSVKYSSTAENKVIIKDYGVAIRMQSPFRNDRTIVLLSGIHTYGTVAAAKYFTEEMQKWRWFFRLGRRNVAALVCTHIIDGYTSRIALEKFEAW